jgi:diaminohydroxyphosphoribosylaminopyrimidine deaminase/5-amino-6-(5-phosphoribosylamino)uracil reductase
VVIGCKDPYPHKAGAVSKLEEAGVEVSLGVCEAEAIQLIRDFAKHLSTGLPFVSLKAAMSLDGKLATHQGDSKWITSEEARSVGHALRAFSDAIMIGVGTLLKDDPMLNVRHVEGRNPLRVLLDSELKIPLESQFAQTADLIPSLIYCADTVSQEKRNALERKGIEIQTLAPETRGKLSVESVLIDLGKRDVVHLLLEGGPTLYSEFMTLGMVDRFHLFVAPILIGSSDAPSLWDCGGVEFVKNAPRLFQSEIVKLRDDNFYLRAEARGYC